MISSSVYFIIIIMAVEKGYKRNHPYSLFAFIYSVIKLLQNLNFLIKTQFISMKSGFVAFL